jgi:hypothetical protein
MTVGWQDYRLLVVRAKLYRESGLLTEFEEWLGRKSLSACSVTPACLPAIAVRRAGCDKSGRQLINGVGIHTYVGSVDFLDIGRCKYVDWCPFGIDSATI